MPDLFIYLIKANIALTLFYMAYRFGLRRLTFYTLNRYFMLFGIACSALFPLVDFHTLFQTQEQLVAERIIYYTPDWNALQQYVSSPDTFTIWSLLQYIFWAGVAVMFIRFVMQFISLLRIHLQSTYGEINKERVRLISGKINPFSFFKNTYINPSLHSKEEFDTILAHEKIHIRQWHSLDVLAGELNHIFYWFNPGAWLMKNAIRENLEFITDRELLQSGINARKYQYSLLKTTTDLQGSQLANNFNLSHLKKRIMMMNKKRSSKRHLLRYVLLMPVVASITIIFTASGKQNNKKQGDIHAGLQEKISIQGDTAYIPTDKQILSAYQRFLNRNQNVNYLFWVNAEDGIPTQLKLLLKNGERELYHLNNSKEIKFFKEKHGNLPPFPTLKTDDVKHIKLQKKRGQKFRYSYQKFLQNHPKVKGIVWHSLTDGTFKNIEIYLKDGEIQKYDLTRYSDKRKVESLYGKIPLYPSIYAISTSLVWPPPSITFTPKKLSVRNKNTDTIPQLKKHIPADYKAFLKRNPSVKSLVWTRVEKRGLTAIKVELKNGSTENYHLSDKTEMKAAKEKYGKFPNIPKPVFTLEDAFDTKYQDFLQRNSTIDHLQWGSTQNNNKITTIRVFLKNGSSQLYHLNNKKEIKKAHAKYGKFPTPTTLASIAQSKIKYTAPTTIRSRPTTPITTPTNKNVITIDNTNPKHSSTVIHSYHGRVSLSSTNPIYFVDNKEVDADWIKKHLKPTDISKVYVATGKTAIDKYGKKGENGIVLIQTKKSVKSNNNILSKNVLYIINDKEVSRKGYKNKDQNPIILDDPTYANIHTPLYVVNNKVVDSNYIDKQLTPDKIYSISVLKDKKAREEYGAKGRYGVIKIFTKAYAKKHPNQFKTKAATSKLKH